MTNVMIWTPLSLYLWALVFALGVTCAIQYLKIGWRNDNIDEKLITFGFSSIWFGLGVSTIFSILTLMQIPGTYINHTFYGNFNEVEFYQMRIFRGNLISFYSGFILYYYAFERVIKRTKYAITIMNIIAVIVFIVFPFNLFYILFIFHEIWWLINAFIFITTLFLYAKWSRLEFKAVPLFIFFGIIIYGYGQSLVQQLVLELNIVPLIIPPILCILGIFICMIPVSISPERLLLVLRNWKIVGALDIGLLSVMGFIFAYYEFPPTFYIQPVSYFLLTIYFLFIIHKSLTAHDISEKIITLKDVSGAFIKPKKVTEEEISISKEKKVCLVCKGKIGRFNIYICPKCDVLYCENCARTLSDLENMCWVCDIPFDESKPVRPYKREEEKVVVEEKALKNSKNK